MAKSIFSLFFAVYIICTLSFAGCSKHEKRVLSVSAAISLRDAFREIGDLFQKEQSDTKIVFNFSSSGALQKQISAGAPVDIYASASKKFMDILAGEGKIIKESRVNFAGNRMVLIVPVSSKKNISSLEGLKTGLFKKIAIGNPIIVPAGKYAARSLTAINLYNKLTSSLIFSENVRQVLDYVATGEVDAGFVYVSDIYRAGEKVKVILKVPESLHDPIEYPIAVIRDSVNKNKAIQFIDMVTSQKGTSVLKKFGFTVK